MGGRRGSTWVHCWCLHTRVQMGHKHTNSPPPNTHLTPPLSLSWLCGEGLGFGGGGKMEGGGAALRCSAGACTRVCKWGTRTQATPPNTHSPPPFPIMGVWGGVSIWGGEEGGGAARGCTAGACTRVCKRGTSTQPPPPTHSPPPPLPPLHSPASHYRGSAPLWGVPHVPPGGGSKGLKGFLGAGGVTLHCIAL